MRLSLRWKWTAALLVVGALPLGALAFATANIQRRGLETAERSLQVAVIDQVGDRVDRLLDEAAEATHRVGLLLTEGRIGDDEARLGLAREAMGRAGVLAHVAIYAPDGALLDAIKRKEEAGDPPPLGRIPDGTSDQAGRWLKAEIAGPAAVLRYVEAVVRDGEKRAWVVGTLIPGLVAERVTDISRSQLGQPDRVVLLDEQLRVLGGAAVGSSLVGQDIFAVVKIPDGAFRSPFGLTTEFAGAEPMVGTVRTLPSQGWAVAVRRPRAEAYAALAAARQALLLAVGVFTLLAVAAGTLLAARTTRPVRSLVELTRAYGRREFARRSEVKTGDELEELGQSMTTMADSIAASEKEISRRAAVEADLSRFMPHEVAKAIAEGRGALELGGKRRTISVLFADVSSFTTYTESAPPERVVAFLNELFTVGSEVIFRHGGTIDKFIGDCIMAVFGAVDDQPDHAARAVAAAEDLQRFVGTSAATWKEKYGIEARLAIGVNSGDAVVGNLGSERRMEYTAIGDAVNVAARLEALARPGQVLVAAETAALAGDEFAFASLGTHPIRGKKQALEIMELQ